MRKQREGSRVLPPLLMCQSAENLRPFQSNSYVSAPHEVFWTPSLIIMLFTLPLPPSIRYPLIPTVCGEPQETASRCLDVLIERFACAAVRVRHQDQATGKIVVAPVRKVGPTRRHAGVLVRIVSFRCHLIRELLNPICGFLSLSFGDLRARSVSNSAT